MTQSVAVCAESYAPSLTVNNGYGAEIGRYSGADFGGYLYSPTGNECVCKVDAYISVDTGDQTGINYHMRVFVYNAGTSAVDSIVGTSSAIAGASINGNVGTWTSANGGYFEFSPCINLSSGTVYALTIFPDDDANLTDDPEVDGSNWWEWGADNSNNGDAIQLGRGAWTWDASIPYVKDEAWVPDATDDGLMKVFTE